MSIKHSLRCAIGELEYVLYLISKDCVKKCCVLEHISHVICKLELTQKKIECLVKGGWISEEQALVLNQEIDMFIFKISNFDF